MNSVTVWDKYSHWLYLHKVINMNRVVVFLLVVIALLSMSLIWAAIYLPQMSESHDIGGIYHVIEVQVLDGHELIVQLEGGDYLRGILSVNAIPQAHREVVRVLNRAETPRVVLLNEIDGKLIYDLVFYLDGEEISLTSWLKQHNLTY